MSRTIIYKSMMLESSDSKPDSVLDSIVKLVPVDVIAAYMGARAALEAGMGAQIVGNLNEISVFSHLDQNGLYLLTIGLGTLVTPIWLRLAAGVWRIGQTMLSAVAFLIWSLSLGWPGSQAFFAAAAESNSLLSLSMSSAPFLVFVMTFFVLPLADRWLANVSRHG